MRTSIVRAYALGIITGGFLAAGVLAAAPAKADGVLDASEQAYGDTYYSAVCRVLSNPRHHTLSGVIGVAEAISDDGFSPDNAVDILNYTVQEYCPSNWPLLQAVGRAARAGATA